MFQKPCVRPKQGGKGITEKQEARHTPCTRCHRCLLPLLGTNSIRPPTQSHWRVPHNTRQNYIPDFLTSIGIYQQVSFVSKIFEYMVGFQA